LRCTGTGSSSGRKKSSRLLERKKLARDVRGKIARNTLIESKRSDYRRLKPQRAAGEMKKLGFLAVEKDV